MIKETKIGSVEKNLKIDWKLKKDSLKRILSNSDHFPIYEGIAYF